MHAMKIEGTEAREVFVEGRRLTPGRSQRVFNHSPDGFNWGYAGSSPAQLALAILLAHGLSDSAAVQLHQAFKRDFVQRWPTGQAFGVEVDLFDWLQRQPRPELFGDAE
jgi:hypothetical protein